MTQHMRILFTVGVAILVATASSWVTAADRPNVLFISVDDLRPELGCYGNDEIKTPLFDANHGIGSARTNRNLRNSLSPIMGLVPIIWTQTRPTH